MRNRTCDGPYYGGLECNGSSINFALCNNHSCPSEFTVKCYSEALVVQPFKKITFGLHIVSLRYVVSSLYSLTFGDLVFYLIYFLVIDNASFSHLHFL